MRIGAIHSHLGGLEHLKTRKPEVLDEVTSAIDAAEKQVSFGETEGLLRKSLAERGWKGKAKDRVAVQVTLTGSAIGPELYAKHLAMFVADAIDVGVEILPMKAMQKQMSSGPGYYEGALYDLARQGRGVPAVPLVLMGVLPA